MVLNTPAPTNKSADPFGLRARKALHDEIVEIRQELSLVKYELACMKRREQERLHLARMRTIHHTQYSHAINTSIPATPAPVEHVQPGDISQVRTHDLPELPSVESVGEDEDSTAIHAAISKAARVTSHVISREHPVEDLHAALSDHVRGCQQSTDVIISNGFVGCLLLKALADFPEIKLRYNGLLPDNEFLCASYEDGGSNGQGTV